MQSSRVLMAIGGVLLTWGIGCVQSSPDPTPPGENRGGGQLEAYPASIPSAPQVVGSGGKVLPSPRFIPVFFAGDPLEPDLTAFLKALGGSGYWRAGTQEYGVGPASFGSYVEVAKPAPPAT